MFNIRKKIIFFITICSILMVGCETTSSGSDINEFGTAMNHGVNTLYYLDPVTIEEAEKLSLWLIRWVWGKPKPDFFVYAHDKVPVSAIIANSDLVLTVTPGLMKFRKEIAESPDRYIIVTEYTNQKPTLENPYLDIKYVPTPHPTADGNGYEMQLRKTSFFEIRFRVQDGLEHLLKGEYDGTFPYMLSCLMTRYLEMKTDIVLVSGVSPGFDNVLHRYSCKQEEELYEIRRRTPGLSYISVYPTRPSDGGYMESYNTNAWDCCLRSPWQLELINRMQDFKYMYGYPKKALPVTNQDE